MKKNKWKPEIEKAWVPWVSIGFGQLMYTCYVPNYSAPIGLVWGNRRSSREGKNVFEVAGSFVPKWTRRQGVRSRINQAIFECHDLITTENGSKGGGLKFLKAIGYRYSKETKLWYLAKPRGNGKRRKGEVSGQE